MGLPVESLALAEALARPEDPAWAVWADELLSSGDARGELIMLERLGASPPRARTLRAAYASELELAVGGGASTGWLLADVEEWRFGYGLALALDHPVVRPGPSRLADLFETDALRPLSRLRVAASTLEQLDELLDVLERCRPPLTRLRLSDGQRSGPSSTVTLKLDAGQSERLCAVLPNLRALELDRVTLARLDHPRLEAVHGGQYVTELGRRAGLPALSKLSMRALFCDWMFAERQREQVRAELLAKLSRLSSLTVLDLDPTPYPGYSRVSRAQIATLLELLRRSSLGLDRLQRLILPNLWALDDRQRRELLPCLRDVPEVVATRPDHGLWMYNWEQEHGDIEPVNYDANLAACAQLLPNLTLRAARERSEQGAGVVRMSWPDCERLPGRIALLQSLRLLLTDLARTWHAVEPSRRVATRAVLQAYAQVERSGEPVRVSTAHVCAMTRAWLDCCEHDRRSEHLLQQMLAVAEGHLACCPHATVHTTDAAAA